MSPRRALLLGAVVDGSYPVCWSGAATEDKGIGSVFVIGSGLA